MRAIFPTLRPSIFAAKLRCNSSLIVNFYAKENGELIDPTDAEISYEIIKSVTSHVDSLGCVKTTVYLSNQYNEMELLNNLAIDLKGKCDWYSLSWNIYSYL